jgi:hypothetical protein
MYKLSEKEKMELKLKLFNHIGKFLDEVTDHDNHLGWLPKNIEKLMTDSAFSVLEAVNSLNVYMNDEDLMK